VKFRSAKTFGSAKRLVDLKASAHVWIDRANLAPRLRIPRYLSPQGQLTLELNVGPGMQFDGTLVIPNAATHPLMPLGAVQDINARLKFAGQQVQVETLTGLSGGAPLGVSGIVDLAKVNPKTRLPEFDLRIRGDNVPLARQPDLILRGDIDLGLSNVTNDVPVVGGSVRLRDSFFLSDLKLLIPGRVAAPRRRPPYFSIDR
jgi:translocation and assembly module TamB